jgi:magnesium transporter
MIRSLSLTSDGQISNNIPPERWADILQDEHAILWLDIIEEPPEISEKILRDIFHFHPLAVANALQDIHIPKVDDWDDYLYLVLHSVYLTPHPDDQINSLELDMFIGKNYLVSYQEQRIQEVENVWQNCQRDQRYIKRGPGYLVYQITDELVEGYTQVIESIEDQFEIIEDQIFDNPNRVSLERIFDYKRILLHLRRSILPQRDVLNRLARNDYPSLESQYKVFFRDVYDHLVRLNDVNDGLRELVSEALSSYLSVVNNHLNDVMKTLTIITTLFMPISFLTGFFGMNFFQPIGGLDPWTSLIAFIVVLLTVILTPLGMYLWIKKQRWM